MKKRRENDVLLFARRGAATLLDLVYDLWPIILIGLGAAAIIVAAVLLVLKAKREQK